MAKPIVVMYIPHGGAFYRSGLEAPETLMRVLNGKYGEASDADGILAPDYWLDYYWFVFYKRDIDEPQLQVFYEKDFTPIKFDELKKFIEDTLKAKEDQP